MPTIEDSFSEDNVLAYSFSCLHLAENVPEKMSTDNIDTLVIPSRGAVPFFLGMAHALPAVAEISKEHAQFYSRLDIHSMLRPLLPSGFEERASKSSIKKDIKVLLVPFTADLNVEKYDKLQNNDEYTKDTRNYWAKVTSAFFKEPADRRADPYFRSFTDVILQDIEQREELAIEYLRFPKINKFALIDTVISGRAANDILKSFETLALKRKNPDLEPYSFLIVDKSGNKLRHPYSFYLRKKSLEGKVEMHNIPDIVSEDKGAALLGVSAIIYPSIMKSSKALEYEGQEFFVGAGSWHLSKDLGADNSYFKTFSKFMQMIYKGVDVKLEEQYYRDRESGTYIKALANFRDARGDFVHSLGRSHLLAADDADTSVLQLRKNLMVEAPYETSSHVVHVPFSSSSTKAIYGSLYSLPGVSQKKPSI